LTEYELIVDSYEQARERPGENEEQKKYYSGKKANHTILDFGLGKKNRRSARREAKDSRKQINPSSQSKIQNPKSKIQNPKSKIQNWYVPNPRLEEGLLRYPPLLLPLSLISFFSPLI
jgi:hypothetical protein